MKAIVVAGGKGERLWPLTQNIAKPMIEVAGKPVLEHIINLLVAHNIHEIILALCYKPESITNYFKDGRKFGAHIEYTFENPNIPLGTAGAIKVAEALIEDDFIVTYADILRDLPIQNMIEAHKNSNAFATLNVYQEFDEIPRSLVKFNDNNEITNFIEHPEVKNTKGSFVWTNGSFYIFKKDIFKYIPAGRSTDFAKNVFPALLKQKQSLVAFKSTGYFIDMGTKEKLELARTTFKTSGRGG